MPNIKSVQRAGIVSFLPAVAVLCAGALALSGCLGLTKKPGVGDASSSQSAIQISQSALSAFQSSFYAFARTNCATCHGSAQSPTFAVSDVVAAYNAARDPQFIDFKSVSGSMYALYAGNGHCGVPSCNGNAAAALAALQTWAAAELAPPQATDPGPGATPAAAGAFGFVSQPLAIPSPLPSPGATFVPMRWPLAGLTPAPSGAGNAVFELEIQQLSATTYHVRNPKIAGLAATMEVQGVHVLIKKPGDSGMGAEQPLATEWIVDDSLVQPSTLPNPLPTRPISTQVTKAFDSNGMVLPVLSGSDMLTIAFEKLQPAGANTITASFDSINANVLQKSCVSCHQPGNLSGNVDLSSYAAVAAQVLAGSPSSSPLYTAVSGGSPAMPPSPSPPLSSQALTAISSWIAKGAPKN